MEVKGRQTLSLKEKHSPPPLPVLSEVQLSKSNQPSHCSLGAVTKAARRLTSFNLLNARSVFTDFGLRK